MRFLDELREQQRGLGGEEGVNDVGRKKKRRTRTLAEMINIAQITPNNASVASIDGT